MKYPLIKLEELAQTSSGGTPNRGNLEYFTGNIPWVKSGELPDGIIEKVEEYISEEALNNSSAKLLSEGTLLIAMYGATVGRLGILKFPAATNQAVCAIKSGNNLDRDYLFFYLLNIRSILLSSSFGGAQPNISQDLIRNLIISCPPIQVQKIIASKLNSQLSEIEKARKAVDVQLKEVENLANALIYESINENETQEYKLGDVLDEVKKGIGDDWKRYPVYGATRSGIAMAKEPPGKNPQRYKPITPGTVFYNPMRIMIGSIAFAEEDVKDGITSPDYVVLKGKDGMVDSRWFYYWLRSPLGEQCINSLARGAVRERMLFNRLAEGSINIPDFHIQKKISNSLQSLKLFKVNLKKQHKELSLLPRKILTKTFEEVSK